MWVIISIANVMSNTRFIAIEYIIGTASYVDGIDEAVFAEGIGKVPEGFLVASGDIEELVVNASYGTAFHLTMQEETARDGAITHKDELAEE